MHLRTSVCLCDMTLGYKDLLTHSIGRSSTWVSVRDRAASTPQKPEPQRLKDREQWQSRKEHWANSKSVVRIWLDPQGIPVDLYRILLHCRTLHNGRTDGQCQGKRTKIMQSFKKMVAIHFHLLQDALGATPVGATANDVIKSQSLQIITDHYIAFFTAVCRGLFSGLWREGSLPHQNHSEDTPSGCHRSS